MRAALVLGLLTACSIPSPPPPAASRTFVVNGTDASPACTRCAAKLGPGERTLGCDRVEIRGDVWERAPYYDATVCFVGAAR